jgi:hypothetical protein
MSVWGCSSPAFYCQPAAAAGFIYCRSEEWALRSPSPTDFVYLEFSWTHAPFVFSSIQPYLPAAIAVLFYLEFSWGCASPRLFSHTLATDGCLPLSKHTAGGGATPTFSSQLVYLQFMWGEFSPPQWSFPHDSQYYKLSCSKVAGQVLPLLLSLASLFIYGLSEGVPLPHSPELRAIHPLYYISFFFQLLVYYSGFFFFFPWAGSVCPGGYADLSQGVPHATYLLTWWSPRQGRSWHLVTQEPSWFFHLTCWGDVMCRLGVWRCQSFASFWWFFLPGVSPVSLQEFTLGSTLSASSL